MRDDYNPGMANRCNYSLQILLGAIAAFAIAAGAFAAPPSPVSGLLVLIVGTCLPAMLIIVWRSGRGYRRSFVIGAAAPLTTSAYCSLRGLERYFTETHVGSSHYSFGRILNDAAVWNRSLLFIMTALGLGGGLAGLAVHWAMEGRDRPP